MPSSEPVAAVQVLPSMVATKFMIVAWCSGYVTACPPGPIQVVPTEPRMCSGRFSMGMRPRQATMPENPGSVGPHKVLRTTERTPSAPINTSPATRRPSRNTNVTPDALCSQPAAPLLR
ncbi:MAG: hypothetical protein U1E02_43470 [Hydrogenophaga sp.]|nr:hypothetical protein [Hydrogenophaga sp.]